MDLATIRGAPASVWIYRCRGPPDLPGGIMDLYQGRADFEAKWNGAVTWDGTESLRVTDETALRGTATDELAYNAVFNKDPATVEVARALIRGAAAALEVRTASIKRLYDARGRG